MKICFPAKSATCLRAVLLFGLLNGLLFSCGEGIRLLPFPHSGISGQNSFEQNNEGENNYEKNLHRFETQPANSQAKSQKHWLDSESSPNPVLFAESINLQKTRFPLPPPFSRSRLFPRNIGSRAPPLALPTTNGF